MIKKFFSVALAFSMLMSINAFNISASANLSLSAKAAVVIEAESGRIVYAENENEKLSMASTTKIMTSLLALENCELDKEFRVSEEMVNVEGSSMGLLPDDVVTMRAIVYGMLLLSGNDAANVTAHIVSGGLEEFAALMNERAKEIGMTNSNFVTPSGLDDEEHYSTAYDMALLGAEAIKNSEFRNICSSVSERLSYGNPPYMRTMTNHNRFLSMYEGAFGIKTGFTKKSGRCLVTAVERDGVTLVAVTLNAPDDWNDHKKLYDYAFSRISSYELDSDISSVRLSVVGAEKDYTELSVTTIPKAALFEGEQDKIERKILLKKFEYAPLKKGSVMGEARYYLDGELICSVPITVKDDVDCITQAKEAPQTFLGKIFKGIIDFFKGLYS